MYVHVATACAFCAEGWGRHEDQHAAKVGGCQRQRPRAGVLLTNENAAGDPGKGRRQVRELHGCSGPFRQRLGQGP